MLFSFFFSLMWDRMARMGWIWANPLPKLFESEKKVKVSVTQSCLTLWDLMNCSPPGSSVHGISRENTGVGSHSLLQGIFPTQALNSGLLHCRRLLYHLSHQGSPPKFFGLWWFPGRLDAGDHFCPQSSLVKRNRVHLSISKWFLFHSPCGNLAEFL